MQLNNAKEWRITSPSFFLASALLFIPTLIVFAFAFKSSDVYGNILSGWTLDAIRSIITPSHLALFWRTLWVSCLTTLISLSLALPMGYSMARANPWLKKTFLMLIVIPFWSSFLIRVFAWKFVLHPEGSLKKILVAIHLISSETSLLYNLEAVILVMIYSYLPFAVLPIYAAAAKFDFQLIEAAMDLGMTRLHAFFKIFVPGIHKGIITALLMVFIPSIGAYVIPDVLGGPHTEMIGNKIAQGIFVNRNLPQASALSALLSLVVLLPMIAIILMPSRIKKDMLGARNKQ